MQGFLEVTMTLLMEEWRGYDNVVDCTSTSSIEKEDATVPTFCVINGLDRESWFLNLILFTLLKYIILSRRDFPSINKEIMLDYTVTLVQTK